MHLIVASREGDCRRTQFGVIDCRRGAAGEQLGNQGLLEVRRGTEDIISAVLALLDILALALATPLMFAACIITVIIIILLGLLPFSYLAFFGSVARISRLMAGARRNTARREGDGVCTIWDLCGRR